MPSTPTQDIFLVLLKIYLEPSPSAQQKHAGSLLKPALDLISRQSPRLETLETLRLLPPLVPAQDICAFLYDAVRAPIFDTQVVRGLQKGLNEQVSRKLAGLQNRRVRVTDVRMYCFNVSHLVYVFLIAFLSTVVLNAINVLETALLLSTPRKARSLIISAAKLS